MEQKSLLSPLYIVILVKPPDIKKKKKRTEQIISCGLLEHRDDQISVRPKNVYEIIFRPIFHSLQLSADPSLWLNDKRSCFRLTLQQQTNKLYDEFVAGEDTSFSFSSRCIVYSLAWLGYSCSFVSVLCLLDCLRLYVRSILRFCFPSHDFLMIIQRFR